MREFRGIVLGTLLGALLWTLLLSCEPVKDDVPIPPVLPDTIVVPPDTVFIPPDTPSPELGDPISPPDSSPGDINDPGPTDGTLSVDAPILDNGRVDVLRYNDGSLDIIVRADVTAANRGMSGEGLLPPILVLVCRGCDPDDALYVPNERDPGAFDIGLLDAVYRRHGCNSSCGFGKWDGLGFLIYRENRGRRSGSADLYACASRDSGQSCSSPWSGPITINW